MNVIPKQYGYIKFDAIINGVDPVSIIMPFPKQGLRLHNPEEFKGRIYHQLFKTFGEDHTYKVDFERVMFLSILPKEAEAIEGQPSLWQYPANKAIDKTEIHDPSLYDVPGAFAKYVVIKINDYTKNADQSSAIESLLHQCVEYKNGLLFDDNFNEIGDMQVFRHGDILPVTSYTENTIWKMEPTHCQIELVTDNNRFHINYYLQDYDKPNGNIDEIIGYDRDENEIVRQAGVFYTESPANFPEEKSSTSPGL